MNGKRRGLGRGLDALLGGGAGASPPPRGGSQLQHLPVDVMRRGRYQPRADLHPETLEGLADSIRAQGVVQPIVVRATAANEYEIIAGERRWRAAQMAGLHEVPVVVRNVSDQAAMAMALIENIQREDLNPMEEATALRRLIDEFGLTHQAAAEAVGRSRALVSNLLRLFDLNDDVKELLAAGRLEMGHARALLALKGAQQSAAARRVAEKELSVRATEALVRRLLTAGERSGGPALDPDIRRLQEQLSERLGAAVSVQHSAKGKGRLVVRYNSLDELEGILAHFR